MTLSVSVRLNPEAGQKWWIKRGKWEAARSGRSSVGKMKLPKMGVGVSRGGRGSVIIYSTLTFSLITQDYNAQNRTALLESRIT